MWNMPTVHILHYNVAFPQQRTPNSSPRPAAITCMWRSAVRGLTGHSSCASWKAWRPLSQWTSSTGCWHLTGGSSTKRSVSHFYPGWMHFDRKHRGPVHFGRPCLGPVHFGRACLGPVLVSCFYTRRCHRRDEAIPSQAIKLQLDIAHFKCRKSNTTDFILKRRRERYEMALTFSNDVAIA